MMTTRRGDWAVPMAVTSSIPVRQKSIGQGGRCTPGPQETAGPLSDVAGQGGGKRQRYRDLRRYNESTTGEWRSFTVCSGNSDRRDPAQTGPTRGLPPTGRGWPGWGGKKHRGCAPATAKARSSPHHKRTGRFDPLPGGSALELPLKRLVRWAGRHPHLERVFDEIGRVLFPQRGPIDHPGHKTGKVSPARGSVLQAFGGLRRHDTDMEARSRGPLCAEPPPRSNCRGLGGAEGGRGRRARSIDGGTWAGGPACGSPKPDRARERVPGCTRGDAVGERRAERARPAQSRYEASWGPGRLMEGGVYDREGPGNDIPGPGALRWLDSPGNWVSPLGREAPRRKYPALRVERFELHP